MNEFDNFDGEIDEDFEGEILEYFDDEYQEYWRNEIKRGEWSGCLSLFNLLENDEFFSVYGEDSSLIMLVDGESLLSFCILSHKNGESVWSVSNFFTFPSSRNKGYEKMLLNYCKEKLALKGIDGEITVSKNN